MANSTNKTTTAPKANVNKKDEEKVLVIVPKPHNVTGDTETVVSVNGKMYQIMYDRPVSVPRNVAEVIEQSNELRAKILKETEANILKAGKGALAEL